MPTLVDPATGEVYEADAADAQRVQRDLGWRVATDEEVQRYDTKKHFSSTEQTAAAALELGASTATFGLVPMNVERQQVFAEESPVLSFAAEAAGSLIPGAGAAGVAVRAAKAIKAGGRLTAAMTMAARGGAEGLSIEAVESTIEGRQFSPWLAMGYGMGGELAGRLVGAGASALGRGARRVAGWAPDSADSLVGRGLQRAEAERVAQYRNLSLPEKRRLVVESGDHLIDGVSRDMTADLRKVSEAVRDRTNVAVKHHQAMAPLMPKKWTKGMGEQSRQVLTGLDQLKRADLPKVGGLNRKLLGAVESYEAQLTKAAGKGNYIEVNRVLDATKRALDDIIGSAREVAAKEPAKRATYTRFADRLQHMHSDRIRGMLEDSTVWGRAGDRQRLINAALHEDWIPGVQRTGDGLETRIGPREWKNGQPQFLVDAKKVRSTFSGDDIDLDTFAPFFERQLNGAKRVFDAELEFGLLSAADHRKLVQSVENIRSNQRAALEIAELRKAGKPPDGLREVVTQLPVVGAMARMAGAAQGIIGNAARAAVNTADRAVYASGVPWQRFRMGLETGASAFAATSLARFTADYPSARQAYRARVESLRQVAQDPATVGPVLDRSYRGLAENYPEEFAQVAERVATAAGYLLTKLPPGVAVSMQHPNGVPPGRDAIEDFSRLWQAVWEPDTALHDIAVGQAFPDQIDALRNVHPDLYAQLTESILQSVARLREADVALAPQVENYLGMILGDRAAIDGLSDEGFRQMLANVNDAGGKMNGDIEAPPAAGIAAISAGPTSGG
jgi:hypothetical protein